MEKRGIHRVTVDDGVELAGHVYGEGPPIVFVHGSLGDGEMYWTGLASHLGDRFRCYLLDMRGGGMSDDHHDLSPKRMAQDVADFADSIGGPVGIFGTSGGAMWALGAAVRSEMVAAVAANEPGVFEVQSPEQAEEFQQLVTRVGELADQGDLKEAANTFNSAVLSEEEWETITPDYLEGSWRYVPRELRMMPQEAESDFSATAPEELKKIDVPVLLLHGTRGPMSDWFYKGVRHVAQHVEDAQIRKLEGLGHAAPVLRQPTAVADELRQFFEQVLPRAQTSRPGARM